MADDGGGVSVSAPAPAHVGVDEGGSLPVTPVARASGGSDAPGPGPHAHVRGSLGDPAAHPPLPPAMGDGGGRPPVPQRATAGGGGGGGGMAAAWISSPILDLRYGQTVVSSSPFSSAKVPLARTETVQTPFIYSTDDERRALREGAGSQTFPRRMNYPPALYTDQSFMEGGFGAMRDPDDIRKHMGASKGWADGDASQQTLQELALAESMGGGGGYGGDGATEEGTARPLTAPPPGIIYTCKASDEQVKRGKSPNPYWFNPPPTKPLRDPISATNSLPRDYLHPLLSALQAQEYTKAEAANPLVAEIASPNRQKHPSVIRGGSKTAASDIDEALAEQKRDLERLRLQTKKDGQGPGSTLGTSAGGIGSTGISSFGTREREMAKGPDSETNPVMKNYSVSGGLFSKDQYAPTTVATKQASTLTSKAARMLASAIHSTRPINSIPSNAVASAQTLKMADRGPVVPPSMAYRMLSPELQHILRRRGNFTRSKVAEHLYTTTPVVQPPPKEPEISSAQRQRELMEGGGTFEDGGTLPGSSPAGENLSPPQSPLEGDEQGSQATTPSEAPEESDIDTPAALRSPEEKDLLVVHVSPRRKPVFLGTRSTAALTHTADEPTLNLEPDSDEEGAADSDPALGPSLSMWKLAVQNNSLVANTKIENLNTAHLINQVTAGAQLRVITPELVTAFNIKSNKPDFSMFFNNTGLRMGDHITRVKHLPVKKPKYKSIHDTASLSGIGSVLNDLEADAASGHEKNLDYRTAPSSAFAFDSYRLLCLLTEKGTEVEQLYFEGMQWLSTDVLSRVGDFCPNLRLLNLSRCDTLNDAALMNIAKKCSLLSYVNVGSCVGLTGASVKAIASNNVHLSVLCCHAVPSIDPHGNTFDKLYQCRNLRVLDLSYCDGVSDMSLVCISKNCPGLTFFDISGCHKLGDVGLRSIGGRCSYLQVWKMRLLVQPSVTAKGLALITQAPRNLQELDLGGITQLEDATLEHILQHAQSLKKLSIAGCAKLTDAAVNTAEKHCKQLRSLNISSCKGVSLNSCMDLIFDVVSLRTLIVSESSISNAECVILQSLRPNCTVVRNQYRPQAPQQYYTKIPAKKPDKPKKADDKKKKKK